MVSIIIPTYNRGFFIGQTLESVCNQTYSNWECIVVDDGSTDNTRQVVQSFCDKDTRFIYLQRPKNRKKGGNAARNYGFEMAKGSYIQWFDSDDIMEPDLLELQLENIIDSKKSYSICLFERYDATFTTLIVTAKPQVLQHDFYYDFLLKSLKANVQTILFSKKIILGNAFSENLLKFQDYEFLQRIFRHHPNDGALLNKVLVKVRRHADSITEKLTAEKCASALQAILIARREMPPSPTWIENKVSLHYLNMLYLPFSQKMTGVFFKYLIKLQAFGILKSLLAIPFLALLYFLYNYFGLPTWYYKHIYKLYKL